MSTRRWITVGFLLGLVACESQASMEGAAPAGVTSEAAMVSRVSSPPLLPESAPPATAGREAFTIVVLPDTQFYASTWPEVFEAQTKWIVANKEKEKIAFVLHEGDIVNYDETTQWERAAQSLRRLDGVVPYSLATGNHDLARGTSRRGTLMNVFFPPSRFVSYPWFGGTYEPDDIQNNYMLVDGGGQKWLVLSLEFGPRDGALAWADGILARYPNTPAIVVTHAYLYRDDSRYDHTKRPDQEYNPHDFVLEGGANDGEEMYQKLISRHDNVKFVLSGHVTEPGTGRTTSVRPSGTKVHELLANYQTCASDPCFDIEGNPSKGGNGWLRLMRFEPAAGRVVVRTYSPYLNQYKTDGANEFTLSLD